MGSARKSMDIDDPFGGFSGAHRLGLTISLDHGVYFYADADAVDLAADWVLVVQRPLLGGDGRATVQGRIYSRDGTPIALTVQVRLLVASSWTASRPSRPDHLRPRLAGGRDAPATAEAEQAVDGGGDERRTDLTVCMIAACANGARSSHVRPPTRTLSSPSKPGRAGGRAGAAAVIGAGSAVPRGAHWSVGLRRSVFGEGCCARERRRRRRTGRPLNVEQGRRRAGPLLDDDDEPSLKLLLPLAAAAVARWPWSGLTAAARQLGPC